MKKIAIFILFASSLLNVTGQGKVTKQTVDDFFKSKTCVVLNDEMISGYNIEIQDVVKREWTITPFEIITWAQFEERKADPSISFLLINQVRFESDKTAAMYNFCSLVMGGNYRLFAEMPDLCPIPLSYSSVDEDSYLFKLNTFIIFMQQHLEMLKEHPERISSNIFKYYAKNTTEIKGKTLCLLKDELTGEINTLPKIQKVYKGKVELLTKDELHQKIIDKEDIVFFHKVGPNRKMRGRCYKVMMGAKDAKLYYIDYHTISEDKPDGLLESDLKSLSK